MKAVYAIALEWADGAKSANDAFRQFASDFLREIAQMILKQIMFNAVKAASSFMGFADGGLVQSYATGGFVRGAGTTTSDSIDAKLSDKEYVLRAKAVKGIGVKTADYINKYAKLPAFANGGLVGAAPQVNLPNIPTPKVANPAEQIANSTSFSANQNFYLVDDPARILDVLKSGPSQENLVVMMSRDPAKFKSALKIG